MAHHQQNNHDQMHDMQISSTTALSLNPSQTFATEEEDLGADNDEPPDRPIQFSKVANSGSQKSGSELGGPLSPRYRKASLLTQALTSPELMPLSDAEAPLLTSDGGMTSPARTTTPSPPLPALAHANLAPLEAKDLLSPEAGRDTVHLPQGPGIDRAQEGKVEEGLGRRRCISFACAQTKSSQTPEDRSAKETATPEQSTPTAVPPKRPCMLRFACPMKPFRAELKDNANPQQTKKPHQPQKPPQTAEPRQFDKPQQTDMTRQDLTSSQTPIRSPTPHRKAVSTTVTGAQEDTRATTESSAVLGIDIAPRLLSPSISTQDRRLQFNRVDFQKSEATRFHEFAGSFAEGEEWANEQTAFRQKITINDTLRKENAIRKIAEEVEEEAREEDEEVYENGDDDLDEVSDDGNESDDEEGFADSDDESDGGSIYQFWTPGNNTAATSMEHLERLRPVSQRVASESSIESAVKESLKRVESSHTDGKQGQKTGHSKKGTRSGTSDFPDSSDFMVGTIDEDQPLEEEYLSRLKQRERSKQKIIPQDIDPSFPTSDPDAENDEDDEPEDDDEDGGREAPNLQTKRTSATDGSESSDDSRQSSSRSKRTIPNPSPRRLHSPPPPPSRHLFGQAVHRLHSPPPAHRKLMSPPSSRRPSLSGSPCRSKGINITRLAQRPNLTHTTSLPRTPNPFWGLHRRSQSNGSDTPSASTSPKTSTQTPQDIHRRGPIEIVQGLENKRQRRKEKFWRHQCSKAHAGKEKERRCQPGKGAQRMREVGLVMADRFKGYKQGTKLVLSV